MSFSPQLWRANNALPNPLAGFEIEERKRGETNGRGKGKKGKGRVTPPPRKFLVRVLQTTVHLHDTAGQHHTKTCRART